jgi:hypothetical protein
MRRTAKTIAAGLGTVALAAGVGAGLSRFQRPVPRRPRARLTRPIESTRQTTFAGILDCCGGPCMARPPLAARSSGWWCFSGALSRR